MFRSYPFVPQSDSSDCGLACLRMVAKFYGILFFDGIIDYCNITPQGISIYNLMELSKKIGFEPVYIDINFDKLNLSPVLPIILLCNNNHFVVLYKIKKNSVVIADPAGGLLTIRNEEFVIKFGQKNIQSFPAIYLLPTELAISGKVNDNTTSFSFFNYLKKYKAQFTLLIGGLLLSSAIDIMFPFLTKKIVDKGVQYNNTQLVYIIFLSQFFLLTSKFCIEFIRSWLIIHIGSRINIHIISDCLAKMFMLPISFFSSKSIGDIIKRINDNNEVETFFSDSFIKAIFSVFSFLILSIILFSLHPLSFLIFSLGCFLRLVWTVPLLSKIKQQKRAEQSEQSEYQAYLYETVAGLQETKLNNIADQRINQWENIQTKLFFRKVKSLRLNHLYKGSSVIIAICICIITLVCSLSLSHGKISIGDMFAIFIILGQLSVPISDIINAGLHWQYAKSSFERLDEIKNASPEGANIIYDNIEKLKTIENNAILFKNVCFTYIERADNSMILNNIDIEILPNKTNAIVGLSGSGKTTILKLLLKLYELKSGQILIGDTDLKDIPHSYWRNVCGAVLQDNFVYSSTIAYNISMSNDCNNERLKYSIKMACLSNFIEELPLGTNTRIGQNGWGISQGQRQRILIARVIYKDPQIIFFDEATNALDAENEANIVENLSIFFKNKTVILVAHRLSTVRNADKIIVLENGMVHEVGNHNELIKNGGKYFSLIKNQLELTK